MEENLAKNKIYKDTTATEKIFALTKRIRAVKGGTSASKTISILIWCIDYCNTSCGQKEIITVASESFPHLSLGAIRDFKNIMQDAGYWDDNQWNASKNFYTFETGNILEFMSVDTYSKAHGPRRDVLFLNECNPLPWEIVDQLMARTRKTVWMDWNPSAPFWFHTEILPHRDDVDYITLTYKDNEALDQTTVQEIESHKHNKSWWTVYGLGLDGENEENVYKGWDMIDEIPKEARLVRKGLDFGYTNDPTALFDICEWNGGFILDEVLYQKGLFNNEIAKQIGRNQPLTIGDSAEPKSIAEIAMHGVLIIGSKKGKGSIQHGIDAVKSRKIWMTKRSVHGWKEYRTYVYLKDVDGRVTNDPIDINNHAMDAIRYAIADLIPDAEPEDAYVPETPYETPSINSASVGKHAEIKPTIVGPSKNRLAFLQERKANRQEEYVSDTPYQTPGLN